MDCLNSLVTIAPDWVKRLDELHSQIEQRQMDLADLAKSQWFKPASPTRSLRNKGSTESLKPKDDGEAFPASPEARGVSVSPAPDHAAQRRQQNVQQRTPPTQARSGPASEPKSPSSMERRTNEVAATAQRRARAVLRKQPKTESMASAAGPVPTYRSRNMIIVYYDSFVQSFFEELVKFVSAQRNQMRKARMAAKVAEIKRLAELEMPEDESDDDDDDVLQPGDALIAADPKTTLKPQRDPNMDDLKLRYMSTRIMGPACRFPDAGIVPMGGTLPDSGLGFPSRSFGAVETAPSDIYDELDRALEFVQGTCERAAHQFLRDGDCTDEIEKAKKRLEEAKEKAANEVDRLERENPGVLIKSEPPNPRSYRPSTMRRDHGASIVPRKVLKPEVDDEGIQDI